MHECKQCWGSGLSHVKKPQGLQLSRGLLPGQVALLRAAQACTDSSACELRQGPFFPLRAFRFQLFKVVMLTYRCAVCAAAQHVSCCPIVQIEEHMRDHAMDEHESLKLFTSDLEGMVLGDEGYDDKLHQLMEVGL